MDSTFSYSKQLDTALSSFCLRSHQQLWVCKVESIFATLQTSLLRADMCFYLNTTNCNQLSYAPNKFFCINIWTGIVQLSRKSWSTLFPRDSTKTTMCPTSRFPTVVFKWIFHLASLFYSLYTLLKIMECSFVLD